VSQLADLRQKLTKAQGSVGTTRASAPTLKEKDGKVPFSLSVKTAWLTPSGAAKGEEKEDNQLLRV
jgi:hypothetical protein